MSKDYYKILGIDKNATEDEIKKAYRKAAVKWHPDRWTDKSESEKKKAEENFKEAAEANEVLSDPDKRAKYDRYGENWEQMGGGFGPGGFDIDDIFKSMHGGNPFDSFFGGHNRKSNNGPNPGQTIQMKYDIGINEIFNGVSKEVEVTVQGRCKECNGTGGDIEVCSHCNGTGMITNTQYTAFGMMSQTSPCPYCHGTGKHVKRKCSKCNGTGKTNIKRKIKINIQPFAQNGSILKYTGMGCESSDKNGVNGDLIIQLFYNIDNSKYSIIGNTVYEKIEIPYYDCILGTNIEVKLPNNIRKTLNILPLSNDGDKITLKGCGIMGADYIYVISSQLPKRSIKTSISNKEKELLEKIKKLH